MDYSLLLGIHDTNREDAREEPEEEEEEDDYDSGGSGGAALTPPDSPGIPFLNFFKQNYNNNQNFILFR